ncbi:signal peptidase I [Candidatus Magnetaquicoccus inordinatus]|uniref:signal peptidase I n=1 Tax=Candidatus Magnetaquicoccus inordinatus TaxID=2496818 RepID=UPI001D0E5088|nr:signal peptidase I [Candidatus Magnetaquicoccus inordinatus]
MMAVDSLIVGSQPEQHDKRHLLHGLLLLMTGLFMLGIYSIGDKPAPGSDAAYSSISLGMMASLGLIGSGGLFLFFGKRFFSRNDVLVEYYEAIVTAVGIALVVRTFIIEPFKIPSGSMIPTLLVGDYLFVSKMAYGHRIPFSKERFFLGSGPKRGDVAVFEYPQDPRKDYIKRVVGLPGDRITYRNKRLFINGEAVAYEANGQFVYKNEHGEDVESLLLKEKLPGTATESELIHPVLVRPFSYSDITDTTVPPGHYFVMGDNRDNSNDSRAWGFVPSYRLVGEALAIFWSWDHQAGRLRWERLGKSIQ